MQLKAPWAPKSCDEEFNVKPTEDELRDLRIRYQAAYNAYESSVVALAGAGVCGERPSAKLLECEAKALLDLSRTRTDYVDALMGLDEARTARVREGME